MKTEDIVKLSVDRNGHQIVHFSDKCQVVSIEPASNHTIRIEVKKQMKMEKEVIAEWKRFLESDEFQHNPECGTLLIAQHFAEWGRVNLRSENE